MNDREQAALTALLTSPKYGAFPEETVRRTFERALAAHSKVKDADKAARSALHRMSAMYFSEKERKEAYALLNSGDLSHATLFELLKRHTSTRERIDEMDELYARVFLRIGDVERVIDYACGLNPLYLGMRGIRVHGIDVHKDAVELVNRWALKAGYPATAELYDLLAMDAFPEGTLALMMKLLPLLESERHGFASDFLGRVPCRYLLATFPKKTLGGRGALNESHYDDWFLRRLPERFTVIERFAVKNELCFLMEVANV